MFLRDLISLTDTKADTKDRSRLELSQVHLVLVLVSVLLSVLFRISCDLMLGIATP
jgi:hypothetical protein